MSSGRCAPPRRTPTSSSSTTPAPTAPPTSPGRPPTSSARSSVLARPGKGGLGRRLPGRVPARLRPRLRGRGADGRRPVAPARPPARAARRGRRGRRHRHRLALREGRRHGQLAARPQGPVAVGQHLRLAAARARRARRHRRVPGLPGRHPVDRRGERHQGHRLRLPARAVVPGPPPGRQDRRGAHHLQRPRPGRVEDVVAHHRRGHVARRLVGPARPRAAAQRAGRQAGRRAPGARRSPRWRRRRRRRSSAGGVPDDPAAREPGVEAAAN